MGKVQNLICNVMRSNQTSSDNDHVNDDVFLESNEMEKSRLKRRFFQLPMSRKPVLMIFHSDLLLIYHT